MSKRTEQYWQDRFEEILVNNEKLALSYEKEMAGIYEQVKQDLEKELQAFYQRYANETGLDLAEVKKRLNPAQLKKFRTQQKIYLDKVQRLIEQGADLKAYEETLKKLSARAYVTKLQELQNNLNSQIMVLTGEQQVKMTGTLGSAYLEGYLKTMYALQKGLGFGYSFTVPNTDDVEKILKTPWNGNNYSKSIWNNKAKLTNWLNTDLPRHFAAGSSVQQMSQDLVNKVDTNYKNAVRLVRTETNYISNQSTMDAYETQNVDRYQILATLDSRTSEICRDMDGKVFNTSEKKVAVNMPPFHVNCRTTTIPYFADDDLEEIERAAKDENGKYYTVPANMSYREWEKQHAQIKKTTTKADKPVKVKEPEYKELTQDDIDNWSEQVVPKLTSRQKQTIEDYTGDDYIEINGALRGEIKTDTKTASQIAIMRSAMSELPQDARLYRLMYKSNFLETFKDDSILELFKNNDLDVWMSKLGGKVFKDNGFQSATWTPKSTFLEDSQNGRNILFDLKVPKGTKAIPVEKFSLVSGEKEIILNTGNEYIISGFRKVDTPNGQHIIIEALLREEL